MDWSDLVSQQESGIRDHKDDSGSDIPKAEPQDRDKKDENPTSKGLEASERIKRIKDNRITGSDGETLSKESMTMGWRKYPFAKDFIPANRREAEEWHRSLKDVNWRDGADALRMMNSYLDEKIKNMKKRVGKGGKQPGFRKEENVERMRRTLEQRNMMNDTRERKTITVGVDTYPLERLDEYLESVLMSLKLIEKEDDLHLLMKKVFPQDQVKTKIGYELNSEDLNDIFSAYKMNVILGTETSLIISLGERESIECFFYLDDCNFRVHLIGGGLLERLCSVKARIDSVICVDTTEMKITDFWGSVIAKEAVSNILKEVPRDPLKEAIEEKIKELKEDRFQSDDFPDLGAERPLLLMRKSVLVKTKDIFQKEDAMNWSIKDDNTIKVVCPNSIREEDEPEDITIDLRRKGRWKHDFVFSPIEKTTDMKLSTIGSLPDDCDRLTPDQIITVTPKKFIIREFTTTRNFSSVASLNRKIQSYRDPIQRRVDKYSLKVSFEVLSANPTGILHNSSLEKDIIILCAQRNQFASLVQEELTAAGYDLSNEEEDVYRGKLEDTIKTNLEKINLVQINDSLNITEEIWDTWKNCVPMKATLPELTMEFDGHIGMKKEIEKFKENLNSIKGRRDRKTICNLPILNLKCHDESKGKTDFGDVGKRDDLNGNFASMLNFSDESEVSEANLLEMLKKAEENITTTHQWEMGGKERKTKEKMFTGLNRSKVTELLGFRFKKDKMSPEHMSSKDKSKTPFEITTDTSDVDAFIKDTSLYDQSEQCNDSMNDLIKFLDYTKEKTVKKPISGDVKYYVRSRIGQSLIFIKVLLQEISYSMNKFTAEKTLIVKRLPGYKALLLMKSGGSSGLSWFTLLIPKNQITWLDEKIGRDFSSVGTDWLMMNAVSVTRDHISQWLNSFEIFFSTFATLKQQFGNPDLLFCDIPSDPDVMEHLNFLLTVLLEGKAQTSTNLMDMRYITMASLVKSKKLADFKGKLDLDFRPRSRLLIWFYQRLVKYMDNLEINFPTTNETFEDETSDNLSVNKDSWKNLLSFVTLRPVKTAQVALMLTYCGCLHNKDMASGITGDFAMLEKLISEEKKMNNPSIIPLMLAAGESEEAHAFNYKFMKTLALGARAHIEEKVGNYDRFIEKELLRVLSMVSTESIATFKASMNTESVSEQYDPKSNSVERKKLIERVLSEPLLSQQNPFMKLPEIVEKVHKEKLNKANLFKKLQWGKTREIFVVDVLFRVLIKIIEDFASILNSKIDGEYISKGRFKKARMKKFNDSLLEKRKTGKFVTGFTIAGDCTRWCQQFIMPGFGSFLCHLVPDFMKKYTISILNLFTSKRIQLPRSVVRLFSEKPDITSFSEEINSLKAQFLGQTGEQDLCEIGGNFLFNRSNMMQGILHNVSSLLHASQNLYLKKSLERMMNDVSNDKRFLAHNLDYHHSFSSSSDDYSVEIAVSSKTKEFSQRLALAITRTFRQAKEKTNRMIMVKDSKKTIAYLPLGTGEFNSKFMFSNSEVCPLLPIVVAACTIKTATRLDNLQHISANSRTDILSNGGYYQLTSLVQECQAISHYCLMGALNSKIFPYYYRKLKMTPHLLLGLFLFEPDEICGVGAMEFSQYLAVKNWREYNRTESSLLKNFTTEFTPEGHFHMGVDLHQGHSKKYKSFLRNMNLSKDKVEEELEKNPELLFRRARTAEENTIKISMKALSPGAKESFSFQSIQGRSVLSSFMMMFPCLTVGVDKDYAESLGYEVAELGEETRRLRVTMKSSLLALFKLVVMSDALEDVQINTMYPLHGLWKRLESLCDFYRKAPTQEKPVLRAFHTLIKLPRTFNPFSLDLLKLFRFKWFSGDPPASSSVRNTAWKELQKSFPWIHETFEETFDDCIFSSRISLYNFLSRISMERIRTVTFLGPIKTGLSPLDTLENSMRTFTKIGRLFTKAPAKYRTMDDEMSSNHDDLIRNFMINNCKPKELRLEPIELLKESIPILSESYDESSKQCINNSNKAELGILQKLATNPKQGLNLLNFYRMGVIAAFTKRQDFSTKSKWQGKGTLLLRMEKVRIICELNGGYIESISSNNLDEVRLYSKMLVSFFRQNHLDFEGSKSDNASSYFSSSGMFREKMPNSCPVFYSQSEIAAPDIIQELHFTSSRNRLRAEATSDGLTYTIFSTRLQSMTIQMDQGDGIVSDWVDFFSLKGRPSSDLISKTVRDNTSPYCLWLKRTLRYLWSRTTYVNSLYATRWEGELEDESSNVVDGLATATNPLLSGSSIGGGSAIIPVDVLGEGKNTMMEEAENKKDLHSDEELKPGKSTVSEATRNLYMNLMSFDNTDYEEIKNIVEVQETETMGGFLEWDNEEFLNIFSNYDISVARDDPRTDIEKHHLLHKLRIDEQFTEKFIQAIHESNKEHAKNVLHYNPLPETFPEVVEFCLKSLIEGDYSEIVSLVYQNLNARPVKI